MQIKEAIFVTSSRDYKKCPITDKPEIAFIGRSNVGKSSMINMLIGRKDLVKTSAKPGKTQLINHFLINQDFYLVDLPGYGWAKASKTKRMQWNAMINKYLLHRKNLACLFVLLDIRLCPQNIDLLFINWLVEQNIVFAIIFTKADKISKQKANTQLNTFKQTLALYCKVDPYYFITSSKNYVGKLEVLGCIEHILAESKRKL